MRRGRAGAAGGVQALRSLGGDLPRPLASRTQALATLPHVTHCPKRMHARSCDRFVRESRKPHRAPAPRRLILPPLLGDAFARHACPAALADTQQRSSSKFYGSQGAATCADGAGDTVDSLRSVSKLAKASAAARHVARLLGAALNAV